MSRSTILPVAMHGTMLFIKSGPFLHYFDFWSVIYYWHVGPSWFCLYGPIPIRERGSPCPLLRPFPPPSRFWWPPRRTVRILDYVSIHRNDVDGQPWRSTQSVAKASAGWRRWPALVLCNVWARLLRLSPLASLPYLSPGAKPEQKSIRVLRR